MLLAAGRGTRMGALTAHCPKPLLRAGGKHLIEHNIEKLAAAGMSRIIINTAYLGEQLPRALGDGQRYGVEIQYSHEHGQGLETAGGIIHALPLLGEQPFIVVNADIWTDYDFRQLHLRPGCTAHLLLVNNPAHNPAGDFGIDQRGLLSLSALPRLTFSGIGIYHPDFFAGLADGFLPLREPLRAAMQQAQVSAAHYLGQWHDIGTPERLAALDQQLSD